MGQLFIQGKFREAIPLAESSLALQEAALGADHPDVATAINHVAELYLRQGWYSKAEPLLARVLGVRERLLGATHPDVALSVRNVARVAEARGDFEKAKALYSRALDIYYANLGPLHPDVAMSMNNLAAVLQAQGDYVAAEPLYVRAVEIFDMTVGKMHPSVAKALNNLATLYDARGNYVKAEPLYLRALQIREKAVSSPHFPAEQRLHSLDAVCWIQGTCIDPETSRVILNEERASTMSQRWVESTRQRPPKIDRGVRVTAESVIVDPAPPWEFDVGTTSFTSYSDLATSSENLAFHYEARGGYENAEPLLIRARDLKQKMFGALHPDVATSLNNLGMLYAAQGAYAKAESVLTQALVIRNYTLNATHPDVATSFHSLALLRWKQGLYAKAEEFCLRALDIREKVLGEMHFDVAQSLDQLALLHWARGAHATAEVMWKRVLDIRETVLGAMHPEVAQTLNNLGVLYSMQGANTRAESVWHRALAIRENALDEMHPDLAQSLSNLAMLYQAKGMHDKAEPLLTRAAEIREAQLRLELPRRSEPSRRALMMRLQSETDQVVSLHADAMPHSFRALELALTTVLRRKGRVLDSLADNQATLRAHITPAQHKILDELAALSTEISNRRRAPFDRETATQRAQRISELRMHIEKLESQLIDASLDYRAQSEAVTIEKIQGALPRNAALVEFVRYHRFDARPPDAWQQEYYVAYVLPWRGLPKAVALGAVGPIDSAVDAVLAAMHNGIATDLAMTSLRHLDSLVFAPLRRHLVDASHVILSPDAKLHLVPFEALVDPGGHYEIERRLVSYVTSGRDLLRLDLRREPRSVATVVAAPDYGSLLPHARNGVGTFHPLPGAIAEAGELPAYLVHARTLTGDQATKAALAATVGPAVLHIATHGFYARKTAAPQTAPFDASTESIGAALPAFFAPSDSRGIHVEYDSFPLLPGQSASTEDPSDALDRAGLAMAGANLGPDGIVSARELASYDWWGTQLVVLSACETGVGAVPSGEGVYGMRRALALAGVESQVVSLWNVSDSSTRELMRAFYDELSRNTGHAQALRRAKLELLRQPQFAHPYHWAAFVPAGNWTPILPYVLKS